MLKSEIAGRAWVYHKILLCLSLILFAVSAFLLTGCLANRPGSKGWNRQIDVFGLALFSTHEDKSIRGIVPKKEPCLKGFDYSYDPLDITVGYGNDDRIRKISTRNRDTSMFDIQVGDAFPKGKASILQAGFSEGDTPYKFLKDGFLFTLLVDDRDRVFGMTLESLE
jgi:hypothetical protein